MKVRVLLAAAGLLLLLAILTWLGLRVAALYYQADAGSRLAAVRAALPNAVAEDYAQPLSPMLPGQAEQLSQAIASLHTSLLYNSDDSQTFLLLGRAQLLAGQAAAAVEAYRTYTRLRPGNPLGHLELGLADAAQCDRENVSSAVGCPDAVAEWKAAGVDAAQLVAAGDAALHQARWAEAAGWYERAGWFAGSASPGIQAFNFQYRQAVAAALAQAPQASELLAEVRARDATFELFALQDSLRVEGAALRWLTRAGDGKDADYGTPLSNGGSGAIGFMWWNGQATALLSVAQAGDYSLRASLQHSDPAPVEMAIGIDGRQLMPITLARGDNSWETVTLPVHLTKGFHSIDLWYLNDALANGKDRNAAVQWVMVQR